MDFHFNFLFIFLSYRQAEPFLSEDRLEDGVAANGTTPTAAPRVLVDRQVYDKHRFDDEFALPDPEKPTLRQRLHRSCQKSCSKCGPRCILGAAIDFVPFLRTVRYYNWRRDIFMDMMAGISVGMVHIPQGMGFALLAAVAPVYGLYASFWQVFLYMLLGRCRHLSIGTMAVISLIIGAVVEREVVHWKATNASGTIPADASAVMTTFDPVTSALTYLEGSSGIPLTLNISGEEAGGGEVEGLTAEDRFRSSVACSVSLIAGVTMFLMGVLRLGVLTTFMPSSFIGGFTTGAAFHITTTQLKPMFNIPVKRYGGVFNLPLSVFEILKSLPKTNIADLVITIICFTFLVFIKEFINVKYKKKMKIPVPAEMIVVVLATVISFAADLHGRWNVKVVGYIPPGIPGPQMPNTDRASTYVIDGMIAGITSFAISISMVDILTTKHKYKVNPNNELVAYGLTYGLTSFLHCFVGAAAPPRCFVMELTGGKSQMASLFTSLLLLLVLLVIAPVFRYLPNAALACIIVVALFPLFKQFKQVPHLWRVSKPDLIIWVITFVVCVFIDVSIALGVGMFVAIMCSVLPNMTSKGYTYGDTGHLDLSAPLQTHKGLSPKKNVVVFRYESTLYFVTVKKFKKQLYKAAFDPQEKMVAQEEEGKKKDQELKVMKKEENDNHDENVNEQPKTQDLENIKGIVLDCSPICYVDLMGLNALKQLRNDYEAVGVEFVLADCNPNLINKLKLAGLVGSEGPSIDIYPTIQDAVVTIEARHTNV